MATRHISMEAVGFEKVKKQFNLLPMKVRDRVMKGAVSNANTTWQKLMKRMAPRDLGYLQDYMSKKTVQYKGGLITVGITGPKSKWISVPKSKRWTKSGSVNPAKYAHLTNLIGTKKGWRDNAFTIGKGEAQKRFETFFIRGLRREGKKLGMKTV